MYLWKTGPDFDARRRPPKTYIAISERSRNRHLSATRQLQAKSDFSYCARNEQPAGRLGEF